MGVLLEDLNQQLDSPWLTVPLAAAYLKVSDGTLRRMIHDGEIRASRLGAGFRIDRDDLDLLLEKRKKFHPAYRVGSRPSVAARHAHERARKAHQLRQRVTA